MNQLYANTIVLIATKHMTIPNEIKGLYILILNVHSLLSKIDEVTFIVK